MKRTKIFLVLLGALAAVSGPVTAMADMPYPTPPSGTDPYAYDQYLRSSTPPNDFDPNDWHMSGTVDSSVPPTAQELGGVIGPAVEKAWAVTTGRPDVHIAVLDSGIKWGDGGAMADLTRKVALNWAELPPPQRADGTSPCDGVTLPARDVHTPFPHCYDLDGNGVFNVADYANDPRVNGPAHPHFCCFNNSLDLTRNGDLLTPEDLIREFSCFDAKNTTEPVGHFVNITATGPRHCSNGAENVDNDGNGFPHDIAGWNFMERTNDPYDEPQYGHGTGEARDSNAEANNKGDVGTCPSCMVLPLKVGDSFIADVNDFAQAVIYATDNNVSVIQEALGTLNGNNLNQAAIDYAYRHNVVVMASAADEAAGHHNQPGSAANHTIVTNSVRKSEVAQTVPATYSYLLLNGCTNYGGHTIVSVPTSSCSSEAVGKSSGMAGLIYSVARNRGVNITANEVKQILAGTADDINFEDPTPASPRHDSPKDATSPCAAQSDAPGPPDNYVIAGATNGGERYHSIAGWDQYFGYGRVNANCAVRAVLAGKIPPEASIDSPAWWSNLDTTTNSTFVVGGHVAASRASSYTYSVQLAYGVQPHEDDWTTVYTSPTRTSPLDGTLATLTKAQVDAAMAKYTGLVTYGHSIDPNGDQTDWLLPPFTQGADVAANRNQWDKYTLTVRVQVTDNNHLMGEDRKSLQSHHDDSSGSTGTAVPGFPRSTGSDGGSSPLMADLLGDNQNELIFGSSDGLIHALRADGTEIPGWPAHVSPLTNTPPTGTPAAFTRFAGPGGSDPELVAAASRAFSTVLASTAVGDLDRSGELDVVAVDYSGYVYAFRPDGSVKPGFPVHQDYNYVRQGVPGQFNRDVDNRVQYGFFASPTLADLNRDGKLEIVVGSLDRHVYAWQPDGTPQRGFPVLLASPEKVASVDPTTHRLHMKPNAGAHYGTKIVSTAAVGDLLGDGKREIVVGRNEEYSASADGGENITMDTAANLAALAQAVAPGNGRVYAVYSDGYCHGQATCPITPPAAVPANAYVPGWPVKVAIVSMELLPYVGSGVDMAPVLATFSCPLNEAPGMKVGAFANNGPAYVFNSKGQSCYGQSPGPDGQPHDRVLDSQVASGNSTDTPYFPAFGQAAFSDLTGNGDLVMTTPTAGTSRLLDVVLAGHQLNSQTSVAAWCVVAGPACAPGKIHPGFPHYMNDLMFLAGPAVGDLTGSGLQDILQGSATSDFRAFNPAGLDEAGWNKNTGGWTVDTPAIGTVGKDRHLRVANITREGVMSLWNSTADACARTDWPRFHHDQWNSGDFGAVATRPEAITDASATRDGDTVTLTFTAPHGSLFCGNPRSYEIYYSTTGPITGSNAGATRYMVPFAAGAQIFTAGSKVTLKLAGLPTGPNLWIDVQAVNNASRAEGNLGAVSNVVGWGTPGGVTPGSGPMMLPNTTRTGGPAATALLWPLLLFGLVVLPHLRRARRFSAPL